MPPKRRATRPAPAPVESRKPHPAAWAEAQARAAGRPVRLEPLPDGSVRIVNRVE